MAQPEMIGRYRLTALIGRGGMGEVWRAWDSDLLRDVAIKRLTRHGPPPNSLGQLRDEARRACSLRHPAVVSVYDVVSKGQEIFLVEEFIEGVPLRLRLGRPFSLDEFLAVAIPITDALAALAARGILHCDLKPENIMIETDGQPRIVDFGLARAVHPSSAGAADSAGSDRAAHRVAGTPGYVAPEVILGRVPDGRSDVFALGVVFYEMLTAMPPYGGDSIQECLGRTTREAFAPPGSLRADLPGALDRLIAAMLDPDPGRRPEAAEVGDRLLAIEQDWVVAPTDRAGAVRAKSASADGPSPVVADRGGPAYARASPHRHAYRRLRIAPTNRPLLHVQPFAMASPGPAAALAAGGLTEAVRARLAQARGLDILESTTGCSPSLVLSGAVEITEERLRISCRVRAPDSDQTLLEASEEGDSRQPMLVRDRLCERILQALSRRYNLSITTDAVTVPLDAPGREEYLQGIARLRMAQTREDRDAAAAQLERATEADPEFAPAMAALADAHARLFHATRDPVWAERAEEEAHRAFAMAPLFPEVRQAVGEVYLATGKASRAIRVFEEILEADPGNYVARVGFARALAACGRSQQAERSFLEAIQIQPDCWFAHNRLGEFYVRHGRCREALRAFLRVVELAPGYAPGFSNVGAAYQYLGRNGEAIEAYHRSIAIQPNYQALSNLATLLRSEGRMEEAARSYEEALGLNDRDYRVWGFLGAAYELIPGRAVDAERCFRRAIDLAERQREVNPSDAHVLAHLAQYFGTLGQKVAARQHIERALELDGMRADLRFIAATVYEGLGSPEDHARACRELIHALELGLPTTSVEGEPVARSLLENPRVQAVLAQKRAKGDEDGLSSGNLPERA